jgi:hypothetical protein
MSTDRHDAVAARSSDALLMVMPVVEEIYPPRPGIAWLVLPAPPKQAPPAGTPRPHR